MQFFVDMAAVVSVLGMSLAVPALGNGKRHRIAVQVNQDDPAVMNLAFNNVANMAAYYCEKGEDFQIEVVAYGPGLHMLRDDTSPVKERIQQLAESLPPDCLRFSACTRSRVRGSLTRAAMPEARCVPNCGLRRWTSRRRRGRQNRPGRLSGHSAHG